MIEINVIHQIQYILIYLLYIIQKLYDKYILNNEIIINRLEVENYDNIHTLYITYIRHGIKIHTLLNNKNKTRIITIYYNNTELSSLYIENERSKNKKILEIHYLDNYFTYNILEVFNCGIINHNCIPVNNMGLFKHVYNYIGEKRIEYSII